MRTLFANIFGPPKTGKTSVAFSFPPPFYYHRFDRLADPIIEAVKKQCGYTDEQFHTYDYISDVDPIDPDASAPKLWERFAMGVREALKASEGTFIIDGGHRLWALTQISFLPDREDIPKQQQRAFRLLYGAPNAALNHILLALESSPLHVVMTHHTNSVYDAEGRETTDVRPDYFKRVPYVNSLDLFLVTDEADYVSTSRVMQSVHAAKAGAEVKGQAPRFFGYVYRCAYDRSLDKSTIENPTFRWFYSMIFGEPWKGSPLFDPSL